MPPVNSQPRNPVGQWAASKIHPDDQGVMRDYIDMSRGAYKPGVADALNLETDASRVAQHYNIPQHPNPAIQANTFDKVLQTIPNSVFKKKVQAVNNKAKQFTPQRTKKA